MKKSLALFLLLLAVIIGIVTRFYKLGEAPAGLYLDEAGQGYSAYSILKTGKDEFGKSFPVVFRSFTDFKTPVYIYLIVPLIPIFGLTAFTVRFPSFFFSILTFPFLFALINKITPKNYALALSSLMVLLLAVSPWHILFGRTNFESNLALFFFIAGIYFFYKALEKPKWILLSAVLLATAVPSYHAQRIVTPLVGLVLFLKYRKTLFDKKHIKYTSVGAILAFTVLLPTLFVATTPGFLARATGLNIFNYEKHKPTGYIFDYEGSLQGIVNNRLFLHTKEFLSLYTSYFSPRYLFHLGDSGPRSSFPALSTFFVWQLPFYLYGFYVVIRKKKLGELRFFTLTMLLISPIPAAVTRDPYSTIRALQMVIPQTIVVSLGLLEFYRLLKKVSLRKLAILGFLGIFAYSLLKLYSSVIILNEYYRPLHWNYGWQEVSKEIKKLDPNLPIVVDTARNEPYIHLLFFLKYDPEKYALENKEVKLSEYYTNMNRLEVRKIANITTRPIDWKKDLAEEKYMIGDSLALSDEQVQRNNLKVIKDIFYPDGSLAFRIVKNSQN